MLILEENFRWHIEAFDVHRCIRYGQLACFGRHYECWKVYIKLLEQHMLPSRQCLFQQDNAKPHNAAITMSYYCSAVQIFHLQATFGSSLNWKYVKDDHELLQQLEAYIRQEWNQIPTQKLQNLITSMPRHLQNVLKRRGYATPK